jgi:hypothetical protein
MAFCPNCGSLVDAGVSACSKCGAPVAASAPPPPPQAFASAPSPAGFQPLSQPGYGAPLPDVQPIAIILAAASWVVCGPLASLPAVIIARNDLRAIREGRVNPAGQSQSQLAFWIGAVNLAMYVLLLLAIILFGALGFLMAAGTAHHSRSMPAPVAPLSAHPEFATRPYEDLEREVERMMADYPEPERKLWREAKDDLRAQRKVKGTGAMPEVKGLSALLSATAGNEMLWSSLAELERKAGAESGRTVTPRTRPAEAPPGADEH